MTTQHDQISNPTSEGDISNATPDLESDLTDDVRQAHPTEGDTEVRTPDEDQDSFPRSYVEKLRDENAKYRQRAQRSDELAQRLHVALVEATGSLQDPTDLAFDESHLEDPEALTAAIDDLLARKPHLASRRPFGDIGQGVTSGNDSEVNLAEILRSRA